MEPVDRNTTEYALDVHKGQEEIGVINWIALRSRPDISCASSTVASNLTVGPLETLKQTRSIWRYIAATKDEMLTFSGNESDKLITSADASYTPGGDRSRTGVVIRWLGCRIHWFKQKNRTWLPSAHVRPN